MRYLPLLLAAACSDPADEACAVAWSHGYATGLDVGAACYDIAPDVRAHCTQVGTGLDEDACLSCMWDGYDAGFSEGDALCP